MMFHKPILFSYFAKRIDAKLKRFEPTDAWQCAVGQISNVVTAEV